MQKTTNLTFDLKDLVIYSGIKQLNNVAVFSTLPFIGTILAQIIDCMESLYQFLRAQIDEYTLINVYIYQV